MCNFLNSVSSQWKFAVMDLHYSPPTGQRYTSQTDRPVLQLHVTAQFYLENKGKYILKVWGHADPKDVKRRRGKERDHACAHGREPLPAPSPLAPLFLCFLLPLGLPYVKWASQECCLFCLRSSLWSLDLPLFYFRRLFPSLSFSHLHSGLLFPILLTT